MAAAVLLTACQKQDAHQPDNNQQTIATINAWLDEQGAAGNNTFIRQVKENLDYAQLHFEELREGEQFIIVPLKQGFQSRNTAGKHPVNVNLSQPFCLAGLHRVHQ